jgi:hypothetical protein
MLLVLDTWGATSVLSSGHRQASSVFEGTMIALEGELSVLITTTYPSRTTRASLSASSFSSSAP